MALGSLMLDLAGTTVSAEEKDLLAHPHVGGVILFTRNYESPSQLRELVMGIRETRSEILIAVDHEGGRVQRFRDEFTQLPPMAVFHSLYEQDADKALELATDCGWLMASELLAMDIDISLAPVLDVDYGLSEIIGNRSFSKDPKIIVLLAGAFIQGMHQAGMAATGKHFPGHGAVELDSHHALPVDNRSFDEIFQSDLLPYQELIKHGLDAVMPAHIVYENADPKPAGFSSFWIEKVLRDQLGFHGVVFSDDLSMNGAAGVGGYGERAALALDAGCDMVLVCNNSTGAAEVLAYLEQRGTFPLHRLQNMKHCGSISNEQLKHSHRWQACHEKIKVNNIKV